MTYMTCPNADWCHNSDFKLLEDGRIVCADSDCGQAFGWWKPDDVVPRPELEAAVRRSDRIQKDYRDFTAEVVAGLTTDEHGMTAVAGLPVCRCRYPLGGGDASGAFVTHALAKIREGSRP